MNLSEHFTLEEATHSQTAERLGIDNSAPPEIVPKLEYMATRFLEVLRLEVGPIVPSSWWRCPALNARTPGSADDSQHTKAEAVDLWTPRTPLLVTLKTAWRVLPFDQLIWEYGGKWIHLSYSPDGRPRGNMLRTFLREGKPHTLHLSPEDFDSLEVDRA